MRKEGLDKKLALGLLLILTVCVYFVWSTNQSAMSKTATGPVKSAALKIKTIKRAKNMNMTFHNPTKGQCPVCNTRVNHKDFTTIKGKRYEMCSEDCSTEMKANPQKYLKSNG